MSARKVDRGHVDAHSPLYRIVLFAQEPPRYQGVLFASPALEPRSEPPCDHPESGWQRDFSGEMTYCCTFCHAELPEPPQSRFWEVADV